MMRKIILLFIVIIIFPVSANAAEKKSLPLAIGTALSPIGVGAITGFFDLYHQKPKLTPLRNWSTLRLTPFAVATLPLISHSYLGDYSGGLKCLLIKIPGLFLVFDGVGRPYDGGVDISRVRRIRKIEYSIGSAALLGAYAYEIYYLVKKTKEINKKASEGVELGFYPMVYKDQVGLGVSLNF